ncbi:hypothetical protein BsWGS_25373 [Bradybaena similaris]
MLQTMATPMWILVCSALLAGLLSPAAGVCPYNVTTCTCTGTTLVCRNLEDIPSLVSDNTDGNITDLTFTSSKLNNISSNSLPANLQKLTFSRANITSISSDAFINSSTTLRSFTMSSLKYPELPDALLNVNNLTELTLSDVPFAHWTSSVLQHVGKTLGSFVLDNVALYSWPDWLKDFTLLNSLDFSRTNATSIPEDAFTKVNNLNSLFLRSTGFDNITNVNAALKPLSKTLRTLDISGNLFTFIPEVVADLSTLSKLDVSNNIIQEITSDSIPPQLKELDASLNVYLTSLKGNSFPNASSLEVLNLSGTVLTTISDLAFQPLEHLRELYLNKTNMQTIPLALTDLKNLQVLNMDGKHWACHCPRDDKLVRWYSSRKPLKASGDCHNYDFTVDYYLSNTTGKSPCSGYSRVSFSSLLYFCVVMAMGVLAM